MLGGLCDYFHWVLLLFVPCPCPGCGSHIPLLRVVVRAAQAVHERLFWVFLLCRVLAAAESKPGS